MPQIDGLRFVAIASVILYHLQGYVSVHLDVATSDHPLHRLLAQGHFGVPLFFALSGYIICCPFLGPNKPSVRLYFLRRLTRLEPPYLISMLLIFALKLSVLDRAVAELTPHLLASLVYAHGAVYGTHSEVNGVAWSLEVEWQFYLLAPLFFAFALRLRGGWRWSVLWMLILGGGLIHANADLLTARIALSILHYFGFFIAGVWVATSEAHWRTMSGGTRFDLLGFAALVAILVALTTKTSWTFLLPALTAMLMIGALRGPLLRALLGWWPVHCFGAMCYSVYLYHFFVISAVGRALLPAVARTGSPDLDLLMLSIVTLPIVLICCALPYLLIERPFMVWRPGHTRFRDAFSWRAT